MRDPTKPASKTKFLLFGILLLCAAAWELHDGLYSLRTGRPVMIQAPHDGAGVLRYQRSDRCHRNLLYGSSAGMDQARAARAWLNLGENAGMPGGRQRSAKPLFGGRSRPRLQQFQTISAIESGHCRRA